MAVRYEHEQVEMVPLAELRPYDGNAKRHTNEQIDAVEASIREFGFRNPVLAWHNDDGSPEIVAGHARCIAAKNLGMQEVPVIFVDDLSDAQRRALTLVDNQTTMMTGWDTDALSYELDVIANDFDMSDFGFDVSSPDDDKVYTDKVKGLIYEPSGIEPSLSELCDTRERDALKDEVERADVSDHEREFLRRACERFTRFRYDKIADYYAVASDDMREVMETLKLVIVDRGGVMERAAASMSDRIGDTYVEV